MNVAAMNVRILFQKSGVVSDKIGNRKNEWKDYFSCFATVSDSQGRRDAEERAAGYTADHADISFTVRYCRETMAVISTEYRIIWNGEAYNIVKVDHLNMKKHALKFRCEKVRN